MRASSKRVLTVVLVLGAVGLAACEIEGVPATTTTTDAGADAGVYDCAKFERYRKLCKNDPDPIEAPRRICENRVRHPKCGDLGAVVMECLWQLQSRKDMCGADGVTISGKVTLACGDENDADDTCRAQNP